MHCWHALLSLSLPPPLPTSLPLSLSPPFPLSLSLDSGCLPTPDSISFFFPSRQRVSTAKKSQNKKKQSCKGCLVCWLVFSCFVQISYCFFLFCVYFFFFTSATELSLKCVLFFFLWVVRPVLYVCRGKGPFPPSFPYFGKFS